MKIQRLLKKFFILLVRLYQIILSPLFPQSCRFTPTCSEYAIEAIERLGILKGGWMGIVRIFRCHPFSSGGYDPVVTKE